MEAVLVAKNKANILLHFPPPCDGKDSFNCDLLAFVLAFSISSSRIVLWLRSKCRDQLFAVTDLRQTGHFLSEGNFIPKTFPLLSFCT